MTVIRLKKSTIVRARFAGVGTVFRFAERCAPGLGARLARSMWFKLPAGPAPAALPAGATAFTVESMGHAVRGLSWGDGPVVYALHGWGGRGDQFAAFVPPLVAAGHRVVVFDALSHGASDDGPSGAGRAHGVEFGRALDDVVARFGPARAIVAHSIGAVSALLAMRDGWVGTDRLVMIAPMTGLTEHFDRFEAAVGFGGRTRRRLNALTAALTGLEVEDFDLARVAADLHPLPPTLVVHDRRDRETSHDASARFVATLPDAGLLSTDGLGHRRILNDAGVVTATVAHVRGTVAEPDGDSGSGGSAHGVDAVA